MNSDRSRSATAVRADTVGQWCRPLRKDPDRRSCCVRIDGPPPDRPDLATYSQEEQFSLGAAPTWDSPDIVTNQWTPFHLYPETTVTLRNLSPTVSAVNGVVSLYTSLFGLGMPRALLASQAVNLSPGQEVTLLFPLSQAILNAADQRIGTFVRIDHPYDAKRINNSGSQLLADAYTSAAGRQFSVTFPVMNPLATAQQISLSVLPNQLNAVVTPGSQLFAPLEQIVATLSIQVPGSMHGTPGAAIRSDATVVGRNADNTLLGGLTYVIWIDN